MTLGEKLTLLIKEKKLSVRAVAMATELPYRSISQLLESDSHRSLDIDILIPVADFDNLQEVLIIIGTKSTGDEAAKTGEGAGS